MTRSCFLLWLWGSPSLKKCGTAAAKSTALLRALQREVGCQQSFVSAATAACIEWGGRWGQWPSCKWFGVIAWMCSHMCAFSVALYLVPLDVNAKLKPFNLNCPYQPVIAMIFSISLECFCCFCYPEWMALYDETLCQEIKSLLQRHCSHFRREWSEYKARRGWLAVLPGLKHL